VRASIRTRRKENCYTRQRKNMIDQLHTLNDELYASERALRDAAIDYRTQVRDAAEKRVSYDISWAQSILLIRDQCDKEAIKMTVGEKESLAVVECQQVLTECRISEALADAAKKHLDAEQSILSSIQSRARLQQVEANLTNYK
ncbi:MAG TPA: hypothetical protein VNI84_15925, partial [Pyrinomonadaceae bacterium]|nr:hypothetical protein [Pyrinomonadaceae bacterium]